MLVVSVVLAGLALWWPEEPVRRPPRELARSEADVATRLMQAPPTVTLPAIAAISAAEPLPPSLPRADIGKAVADPFAGPLAAAPPPPPVPKPLTGPVYESPPAPPSLNYRFLGQMTDPAGQRWVYLARPDKDVRITVGTRLDEGYVVEAITSDHVRLHYPPLGARAQIVVPPARLDTTPASSSSTP